MNLAGGNRPCAGKLVTAQKRRATERTAARLVNYFIYLLFPDKSSDMPRQKMAGSLSAGRQTYNYHLFYISILYLSFFFLYITSGPEHQQPF